MVRITQQREKCIGCAYCHMEAPHRWHMDESDGKSTLVGARGKNGFYTIVVSDLEWEDNLRAAEVCPVNIIKVEKVNK